MRRKIVFVISLFILPILSFSQERTVLTPAGNCRSVINTSTDDDRALGQKLEDEDSKQLEQQLYVDLGLSVKWATCNIGASRSSDPGNYYSYNQAISLTNVSNRLPSKEELQELMTKCKWEWDSQNNGHKVIGPNGNFIFLPSAGFKKSEMQPVVAVGKEGYYWISAVKHSRVYVLQLDRSHLANLFLDVFESCNSVRLVQNLK